MARSGEAPARGCCTGSLAGVLPSNRRISSVGRSIRLLIGGSSVRAGHAALWGVVVWIGAGRYLGLSEQDATALALDDGLVVRVVARDGRYFLCTRDVVPGRVNFRVRDGVVEYANPG